MITYKLNRSDAMDGMVAVVLHLYWNKSLASVTTIAVEAPLVAVRLCVDARMHLRRLGVPEAFGAQVRAAG